MAIVLFIAISILINQHIPIAILIHYHTIGNNNNSNCRSLPVSNHN